MRRKRSKYVYMVMKPYVKKEIIGFIVICCMTFLTLLNPYIMKKIFDEAISMQNFKLLFRFIFIYGVVYLLRQALEIYQIYIFTYIGEKLVYDLRMNLYNALMNKNTIDLEEKGKGELISQILNEVPIIVNFLAGTSVNILIQVLNITATFIIVYSLNKLIAITLVIDAFFIWVITKRFNPKLKSINTLIIKNKATVNNTIKENLDNLKIIKYMHFYKYAAKKFSRALHKDILGKFSSISLTNKYNLYLSLLYFLPSLIILSYGGNQAIKQEITVGTMIALFTYINNFLNPIQILTNINIDFQASIVAFNRYYDTVSNTNEDKRELKKIKCLNDGIKLNNVSFGYDKNYLFKNINLNVHLNTVVKITGENGTGKSTLVDLLCGILIPDKGEIEYDGININDIDKHSLKKLIAIVPQRTYLFNDTIVNNIKVGRNIDEKIILDLCKKFELINSNNNLNLESMVINNGSNISGGECQKISSLRAIVNNPQIIIFDEFSTFIDEKTKNIFYKYMRQNKAGKIIIVISHETQLDLEVDINIDLSKQKIHIDQNYKEAVL